MIPEIRKLIAEVANAKGQVLSLEARLNGIRRRCQHQFTGITYDPIEHAAYTDPGDPPGTMGIDRRGPVYVSARTENRWRRTCDHCGHTEWTTRTTQQQHRGSIGGTVTIEEVPDFGNGR